jgi:hypothetical protein
LGKPTLNLSQCPHPRSQETVIATMRGYTKVICMNCGLEYWKEDE